MTVQILAFFDARFQESGPLWEASGQRNHWRWSLEPRPLRGRHPALRMPSSLGAYDLAVPEQAQSVVAAAKRTGLSGFVLDCYPVEDGFITGAPVLDPFCDDHFGLAFQWDNGPRQTGAPDWESHRQTLAALVEAIRPWRHLTLDGRPVLIIRRPQSLAEPTVTVSLLRDLAAKAGLPGLYLIANVAQQQGRLTGVGFDALVDPNPAEWVSCDPMTTGSGFNFLQIMAGDEDPSVMQDTLLDYGRFSNSRMVNRDLRGKVFPRVLPAFHDWADHGQDGAVMLTDILQALTSDFHAVRYRSFVQKSIAVVAESYPEAEQAVFIDSWNGWRNGSQLEPSTHAGDMVLRETRAAIDWGTYVARTGVPVRKEGALRLDAATRASVQALCDGIARDMAKESEIGEKDPPEARCPACGAGPMTPMPYHHWDLGGVHYILHNCPSCGYTGTDPMPSARVLSNLYADTFNYGWYKAHRAGIYADAKRRLIEAKPLLGRSILDYGGGNGYLAQAARKLGYDGAVYDPYFGDADPAILNRRWDTVFCLHVLEHSNDPAGFLGGIRDLLAPGGHLILAVPNAAGQGYETLKTNWMWFQGPLIHVSHFTPTALCRLVANQGFELEGLTFHDRWNANTAADLIHREQTKHLEAEWSPEDMGAVAWRNIRYRYRMLRESVSTGQDDIRLAETLLVARKI